MWWVCPVWPKCAFGDQKCPIWNKDMPFGNPTYHETKIANFLKKVIFHFLSPFIGQKVVFWVKNGVLGRFGLTMRWQT